ncbi:MAG: hypothetical protein J6A25_01510 [Lachnospiraceae bacterium]|nr:hypothetical protein [Lachnospiraceae bacterium]
MKSLMSFLLGIVLTIVGAILFLTNVRVSSFTFFFRYNGTNITAILMILMCILVVVYIVYSNFVTGLLLGIAFLAFVISVIMSMKFYIISMTALEVFVILATFFGGIGLTLRGIVHAKDELPDGK